MCHFYNKNKDFQYIVMAQTEQLSNFTIYLTTKNIDNDDVHVSVEYYATCMLI